MNIWGTKKFCLKAILLILLVSLVGCEVSSLRLISLTNSIESQIKKEEAFLNQYLSESSSANAIDPWKIEQKILQFEEIVYFREEIVKDLNDIVSLKEINEKKLTKEFAAYSTRLEELLVCLGNRLENFNLAGIPSQYLARLEAVLIRNKMALERIQTVLNDFLDLNYKWEEKVTISLLESDQQGAYNQFSEVKTMNLFDKDYVLPSQMILYSVWNQKFFSTTPKLEIHGEIKSTLGEVQTNNNSIDFSRWGKTISSSKNEYFENGYQLSLFDERKQLVGALRYTKQGFFFSVSSIEIFNSKMVLIASVELPTSFGDGEIFVVAPDQSLIATIKSRVSSSMESWTLNILDKNVDPSLLLYIIYVKADLDLKQKAEKKRQEAKEKKAKKSSFF